MNVETQLSRQIITQLFHQKKKSMQANQKAKEVTPLDTKLQYHKTGVFAMFKGLRSTLVIFQSVHFLGRGSCTEKVDWKVGK